MAHDPLELVDVEKRYEGGAAPVDVLRGVSFRLDPGDALAVTGPSGCGKSTLLHLIGGLDAPTSGKVRVGDVDPYVLDEPDRARFRNRSVGFVFQDHHLLPQFTVLENVLMPAHASGRSASALVGRAERLVDRVGLSPRQDHRPAQLSGGERQRAAVARALLLAPSLLLCDEPTGSLDRRSADAVAELLFELHRDVGGVLIVVTHSESLASRLPKRCELVDGRCSGL